MTGSTDLDAVIIGGGPAGSAAGIELARAGRPVAIIERTLAMHDKVCGDFLSGEAVEALEQLGVEIAKLRAETIERVRLVGSMHKSSAPLPFAAFSVTRRALDEALLRQAAERGALVLRGHTAEALHRSDGGWQVEVMSAGGSCVLRARDVVLATGKHDMRGLPRPEGEHNGLVGLKMYLRLAAEQRAALAGVIEVVLLEGGYGGLSLVEDGVANLCFVMNRNVVRSRGARWDAVIAILREHPDLRRRLDGAEPLLARPLAVSPIPYGYVRRDAIAPGVWCVGDQAAVIPSFTGDGVALALHSGRLAAGRMLEATSAEAFQAEFCEQVKGQVARATLLSRAMIERPQRALVEITARLWPGALRLVAAGTRLRSQYRISHCENTCTAA